MVMRRRAAQRLRTALAATVLHIATTAPAIAQLAPTNLALIIGNGAYDALPPLPACSLTARTLADTLRGRQFSVVERFDGSGGAIASVLGAFSRRLTEAPDAAVVIYVCGRGVAYDHRVFMLPVSARLQRPSDVLTQGLLAKILFDLVRQDRLGAVLVALDLASADDAPLDGLAELLQSPAPVGLAAIAGSGNGSTLGDLLNTAMTAATVQNAALVASLQEHLPKVTIRQPLRDGLLSGKPAPLPTPPPPPAVVSSAPPAPLPAVAAMPAAAATVIPDEAQMSQNDRMLVQGALRTYGYYAGQPDGVFGPETRAAMRRFQHEIGTEMTGRLTSAQASRLVAKR
jgi:hypothetical protein